MGPVIMQQLAADHIRAIHAKAEDEHRASEARRVRRRALSARLRLPARGRPVTTIPAWTQAVGRSCASSPARRLCR